MSTGHLIWIEDPVGNRLTMAYRDSLLSTVTDSTTGRMLTLHYNGSGCLTSITGPITAAVPDGVWVAFSYDSRNNLTSVTHADGSGYTYEYAKPANHRLTRKRNKVGHTLAQWAYDTSNQCISYSSPQDKNVAIAYVSDTQRDVTDAYGVVRSYTLTDVAERKRVVSMTGTSNAPYSTVNVIRWAYDDSMNLREVVYAGGTVTRYQDYDSRGNPGTVVLAAGTSQERTIRFTYHDRMNVALTRSEPSVLGSGNRITIWDYDNPASIGDDPSIPTQKPTSLLSRIIQQGFTMNAEGDFIPYEYVTQVFHGDTGQVVRVDGPLEGSSDSVHYEYSAGTRDLLSISQPIIGASQLSQYDAAGFPGQLTDVNAQVINFTYDGRARLQEFIYQADGSRKKIQFNVAGLVESRTDEDGVHDAYIYDSSHGRLVQRTDMEGNTVVHGYDDQGNLASMSYRDQAANQTRLKRWSYRHPVYPGMLYREIQSDETSTEYDYDASGNITSVTDPGTRKIAYAYDVLNRVTALTQPGSVITRYGYDRHGNLSSVTDPENHVTVYGYDDMGRLVKAESPDSGTTTYVYDGAANLRFKTDANGVRVEYVYDALSRLVAANYPAHGEQAAYSITYTYDQRPNGKARLSDVSDPSGTTALNYNSRGMLHEKNVTLGGLVFPLTRDLTPGGRVSRITYPSGRTLDFDRSGCVCKVTRVSTSFNGISTLLADDVTYRPFGHSSSLNVGNGGSVRNVFDLNGRTTTANPGTPMERTFSHDPAGRLTEIALTGSGASEQLQSNVNRTFTYDPLGRLETASGPFGTIGYTYDDVGNRLTETVGDATDVYAYVAETNRLSQVTGTTSTAFSQDAAGNIRAIGPRSLVYNQDNRLVRVREGTSILGDYLYNASGQRTTKTVGMVTTHYLYDFEGNLISEADAAGAIQAEYLYRDGVRLAMAVPSTGAVFFFHNDLIGTPQFMTDSTNTLVWEATYKPFGETTVNPHSTVVNNFRFRGQYYDAETGYHYNWHRYYDPKTGRYLTPDPIGLEGGINVYAYVQNDPVNRTDPYGLYSEWYNGVTGIRAHNLFFEWVWTNYPNRDYIFDRALNQIGLGISLNRPDVISAAQERIWELKPITHSRSNELSSRDYEQLHKYACETGFGAGKPTDLVTTPTYIGNVEDLFGNEYRVTIYPGSSGFIYYALRPIGERKFVDNRRNVRDKRNSPSSGPIPFWIWALP
jgi:RHS repeat-associated protein